MNIMLSQKIIDVLIFSFEKLYYFLKFRIQIPIFILLFPIIFGSVYYIKFWKQTKKIEEIVSRVILTNIDLRLQSSEDSMKIIKLNNEKQRIIDYHFAYLDTLSRLPRAKLQAELSRYYEK